MTELEEDKQDDELIHNEGMFLTLCVQVVPKKGKKLNIILKMHFIFLMKKNLISNYCQALVPSPVPLDPNPKPSFSNPNRSPIRTGVTQ